jgi:phosphoenolpyruvate phosphomutase
MKSTTALKRLLRSEPLEFITEAHNGLSAKIVEEAGFKGIWASSLTISAALGVRDNNEASWTQVLEILEFMSDTTNIPILLDGDTGYGNFNNVRRLVAKIEQRGIAGVCIEDKLFPKTNSFIGGEQQPLAEIEEFCGKIKAAKDTQTHPDFQVVARIEAFIAGWGLDEVLRRAHAYRDAGADALLIHSKISTPDQISSFMQAWDRSCPIVIVPTKYYKTPTDLFRELGISVVIWANHILRSSVTAIQETARVLHRTQSLSKLEGKIAPVAEIFRLQGADELKHAEKQYLPIAETAKAIILAASRGRKFGDLTRDIPKTMLPYNGKPLLRRLVETFNNCGIKDISVVLGHKANTVSMDNIQRFVNRPWKKGGIGSSLFKAIDKLRGPVVIAFGDILFEENVLFDLLETNENIVLAVDTAWANGRKLGRDIDAVRGVLPPSDRYGASRCVSLEIIGTHLDHKDAHGEWIGLLKLSSEGSRRMKAFLESFYKHEERLEENITLVQLITAMQDAGDEIYLNYSRGRWLDVDSPEDLQH